MKFFSSSPRQEVFKLLDPKVVLLFFFFLFVQGREMYAQTRWLMSNEGVHDVQTGDLFFDDNRRGDYSANKDYTFTMRVPDGSIIKVDFVNFSLESHRNCGYDWLKIFDGSSVGSTAIGTYCGTWSPGTVTSKGRYLTFQFHSDQYTQRDGWKAKITVISREAYYGFAISPITVWRPSDGAISFDLKTSNYCRADLYDQSNPSRVIQSKNWTRYDFSFSNLEPGSYRVKLTFSINRKYYYFDEYFVLDGLPTIEVDRQAPEKDYDFRKLVTDVLVTGCLSADNIRFTGDDDKGIGFFSSGTSSFPLKSGIILSTGEVRSAENGTHKVARGYIADGAVDDDVREITGGRAHNVQVLEFDFVPAGNMMEFNYIFASEEYPDYACSQYNDVFAFILSGEGVDPDLNLSGKNIAIIPGTDDKVSINNVYDPACDVYHDNSDYYVDDRMDGATVYNGRTEVLTARAKVKPCTPYHIRLIVADVNDSDFDSAVFLEARSFKSNEVQVENSLDGMEGDKDVMYRGCEKSFIRFFRTENVDEKYSFRVTITGSAVNGVDYYLVNPDGSNAGKFPEEITFPAGVDEVKYYYMASDAVKGEKNIKFEVLRSCPCDTDLDYFRKEVKILDIAEIEAKPVSNVTCNGGSPIATVVVQLKAGLDPANYLYSLDGGDFQPSNVFQGNFTVGEHEIVIQDKLSCKSKIEKVMIPRPKQLKADAGSDFSFCELQSGKQLSGQGGIKYTWTCDKSEGLDALSDPLIPSPQISPDLKSDTYIYTLTVSDGLGNACSSSDFVKVVVNKTPVMDVSADQLEICSGNEIKLSANVSNTIAPVTYAWTPLGEIDDANRKDVVVTPKALVTSPRTYTLTVSSGNGCSAEKSVSGIKVFPNPVVNLNALSRTCSKAGNGVLNIDVDGGTPFPAPGIPYRYLWDDAGASTLEDLNNLDPGNYRVIVTDAKGCSSSQSFTVSPTPDPQGIFHQ
ncbi:MAG: choice-of-anchor L domain-containing protein [Marinifilaceae bacterium]